MFPPLSSSARPGPEAATRRKRQSAAWKFRRCNEATSFPRPSQLQGEPTRPQPTRAVPQAAGPCLSSYFAAPPKPAPPCAPGRRVARPAGLRRCGLAAMGSDTGSKAAGPLAPVLQKAKRFWAALTLKEKAACGAAAGLVVRRAAEAPQRWPIAPRAAPCAASRPRRAPRNLGCRAAAPGHVRCRTLTWPAADAGAAEAASAQPRQPVCAGRDRALLGHRFPALQAHAR